MILAKRKKKTGPPCGGDDGGYSTVSAATTAAAAEEDLLLRSDNEQPLFCNCRCCRKLERKKSKSRLTECEGSRSAKKRGEDSIAFAAVAAAITFCYNSRRCCSFSNSFCLLRLRRLYRSPSHQLHLIATIHPLTQQQQQPQKHSETLKSQHSFWTHTTAAAAFETTTSWLLRKAAAAIITIHNHSPSPPLPLPLPLN